MILNSLLFIKIGAAQHLDVVFKSWAKYHKKRIKNCHLKHPKLDAQSSNTFLNAYGELFCDAP
jgi:hypothetical protein